MVEDLLPDKHNAQLLTLLYRLAEWHALAKLRMHTEDTLQRLETTTTAMGKELCSFRASSATAWICKELPSETAALGRKLERKRAKVAAKAAVSEPPPASELIPRNPAEPSIALPTTDPKTPNVIPPLPKLPAKVKTLNLFTYKLHALGDYVRTIRLFGTTDSYSTQIVRVSYTF